MSKESHPDKTQFDTKSKYYDPKATKKTPRWFLVEIEYHSQLKEKISLSTLRKYASTELKNFPLLQKGNRLSILPISQKHWSFIHKLAKKRTIEP